MASNLKKLLPHNNNNGNNNHNKNADALNYEVQESFSFGKFERPLLVANCSEYAVAHSNVQLQPARQMGEVCFLPHILHTMRRLKLTHVLRLQSYAWPHLRQGEEHGAVIVSAPRSGRTLSYVLPLCQAVCTTFTEQRASEKNWELIGAVALVLAADLGRVQQIGSMCNAILRKAKNEEWLTLVLTVPSACTPEFFQCLLNGVGCLVATPAQFLWLRSQEIKMPYLRFVVYDDVDLMPTEQVRQVHQQLLLLLAKQQKPQMVITAQSFQQNLLQMLIDFNAHPMVLFGDVLEAAVYGGTRMRIVLVKREAKNEQLLELLEQRPPQKLRTVINCHTDKDMRKLVKTLQAHGYSCLPYYQTSDMIVRDHVQRWMQKSRGEVLLCTDQCPELDIRHAHTLVHYGMSDSWSKFKLRHLALSDNLRNQFAPLEMPKEQGSDLGQDKQLLSLVYLDESNNMQLPRLVDFLKMHQHVDERVVRLANHIRNQLERAKCNEPALCDLLLSMGNCGDTQCEQRHQLLPHDTDNGLPASGDVKLQILKVYSPAHYSVRLLEHLVPGGTWQPTPRQSTLEMQLQLLQSQERVRHWPPQAKQICVYHNVNLYERVRILRVAPIAQVNLSRSDIEVEVQAMDIDTRQFKTTSGKLYVCPEQLREAPPLAVDMRILGMVPFTGERNWHEEDAQQCEDWLKVVPQPNFLQAKIVISLSHTLFAQDLVATSYAPSLKIHVRCLSMCKELKRHQLAKKCDQAIAKLMQFLGHAEPLKRQKLPLEEEKQKLIMEEQNLIMEKQKAPMQEPKRSMAKTNSLPVRGAYFAKMALQMGLENRLRLEKEHQSEELVAKETSHIDEPEDSIDLLYKCLMDCTVMDMSPGSEDQPVPATNSNVPEVLLTELMGPLPTKQQNIKKTAAAVVTEKRHKIEYQIPANVVRPEVIYYQTSDTLELQVIIPEDHFKYEAVLHNGACIGFWTLSLAAPIYQFIINTQCPYKMLSHHMLGRTIYISVQKVMAVTYPLEFSFYKFMKPHHEKLHILDQQRRSRITDYETYLIHKGYIPALKTISESRSEELSCDEQDDQEYQDPSGERVERVDRVFHDD